MADRAADAWGSQGIDIPELAAALASGKVVPFVGAGLSRRSGLPVVPDIVEALLDLLLQNDASAQAHKEALLAAALPFEVIIEQLVGHVDITSLFLRGRPNASHRLFAQMVARGALKLIVTTNFDVLIEKALEEQGLCRGVDFEVASDDRDFEERLAVRKLCHVLKLHGCASRPNTVRTTVRSIAAQQLLHGRAHALRHVFASGDHHSVLMLGYSGSDVFDINPFLATLTASPKDVFMVRHTEGAMPLSLNPVQFRCTAVHADTEEFLRALADALKLDPPEWHTEKIDWQSALQRLMSGVSSSLGHQLAARLLFQARIPDMALDRSDRALWAAKRERERRFEVQAHGSRAMCLRMLGRWDDALLADESALALARGLDPDLGAGVQRSLGNSWMALNRFHEAESCLEQAAALLHGRANLVEEHALQVSIGLCASSRGDRAKARDAYREALWISQESGDLHGAILAKLNLWAVSTDNGAVDASELRTLLEEARALGDPQLVSQVLNQLGAACAISGDRALAEQRFLEALSIKERIQDARGCALVRANLEELRRGGVFEWITSGMASLGRWLSREHQ